MGQRSSRQDQAAIGDGDAAPPLPAAVDRRRIGRASLISRLSDSPPCPAQWARVRRLRVMVRWARGVAAAAVAIARLGSEPQYERRAGSAAVVPASPLARAQ